MEIQLLRGDLPGFENLAGLVDSSPFPSPWSKGKPGKPGTLPSFYHITELIYGNMGSVPNGTWQTVSAPPLHSHTLGHIIKGG